MMASPKLLITGATGFIGFKILLDAIEAGYIIRAAIRSASKLESLFSNPVINALDHRSKVSFIEVPDILKEGAYDEALDGITHIIHVASPLPFETDDPEKVIFQPAFKGTTNLLASALKTPTIKRIVFTSSILSNTPLSSPDGTVITAKSRLPSPKGPFTDVFSAYNASKICTLNAIDDFVQEKKPSFDIIVIMPGFVYGRDKKATDTESLLAGSNGLLLASITGKTPAIPRLTGVAHVNDVAKVHVLALQEKVNGGQAFGVTAPVVYEDAFDMVRERFPKGTQKNFPVNWDASKTEETFGLKFQTFKDIVLDVASQYLEFEGAKKQ